ncbi:UNVERIFIED_CONTAM: hypothetical protein HDU68_009268 [Siphonaria sp. JEL0065]|nr:hypothetical protein HDU68_009268 [Siphonaria sp. JEL0065]
MRSLVKKDSKLYYCKPAPTPKFHDGLSLNIGSTRRRMFAKAGETAFLSSIVITCQPHSDTHIISFRDARVEKNRPLGAGGFGSIFAGTWSSNQEESIRREAKLMSKLRHPNIVTLWGVKRSE